jgi:TetR/AcrR family transcriptional regulator, transcriptional repressor for nem operon
VKSVFKTCEILIMPKVKLFNPDDALLKAKDVFWQKGFNATSMQDLIDGMQISRQSLYDTFGNKQDLFEQCLTIYQKEAIRFNCDILESTKNTKAIIQDFFDYLVESITTDTDEKSCFMINTLMETIPVDSEAQAIVLKNVDELENAIFSVLEKGKKNNDFTSDFSNEMLTNHFITAMHGIKVIGKIKKDKATLDNLVKTAMCVLK